MGVFLGEIYEGQAFRHGPPDHLFTQEVEMGLPYRFEWRRKQSSTI